jgi:hypothetical protein
MKKFFTFCFLFFATLAYAQSDSIRAIEPNKKTSYDSKDLILIALAALALLVAMYFLFRRAKGTRN